MDFLVEDGTGLELATAYAAVAEVDSYLSVNPNTVTWEALSDAVKENYIMWASRTLDQIVDWHGNKVVKDSGLRWPRAYVYDRDGYALPYDEVPGEVKEATAILAFALTDSNNDVSAFDETTMFKRIVVDVIELEYRDGAARQKIPRLLQYILKGLGRVSMMGGQNFVAIRKA